MIKKTIYSLVVTAILLGAIVPLNTKAIDHSLIWHSSLDDETIAWRIYDQFLFNTADPPTLAGEDLFEGSVLAFEINDTLPKLYHEVYEASHPPQFLKLFVNYNEVSFYDINDNTEPSFALQFLVIPYVFHNAASGLDENITQFLEYRAITNPNITSIDYYISGGNYVTVTIYNDYLDSFQVTYNNNTGICSNFFIEDDFGEMFGQLDIWESGIDDAGVVIDNTLNFHPNLGAGTILSWKYTEITYEPGVIDRMEVNNVTLEVGHVFSFEYNLFPTNPLEYYGGDYSDPSVSFFDVFFEGNPMEWTHVTRGQLVLWVTLTNPLSCTLYNGTIISMEDISHIRDLNDPGIENTLTSISGSYMTLSFNILDDSMLWSVELEINVNSGIVQNLAIDLVDFVHFEMEFAPENSSLLINGEINTPSDENGTWTLSGYNWYYLLFSIIAVLPIIRRRKR